MDLALASKFQVSAGRFHAVAVKWGMLWRMVGINVRTAASNHYPLICQLCFLENVTNNDMRRLEIVLSRFHFRRYPVECETSETVTELESRTRWFHAFRWQRRANNDRTEQDWSLLNVDAHNVDFKFFQKRALQRLHEEGNAFNTVVRRLRYTMHFEK